MPIAIIYNPNLPWSTEFLLLDADGTPSDLSGSSLRMHVRSNIESNKIIAIASTENSKIIFKSVTTTYNEAEVTGTGIEVSLLASDTLAMYQTGVSCVADVEITYPDNKVFPEIIQLQFKPNLSVTRDFDV